MTYLQYVVPYGGTALLIHCRIVNQHRKLHTNLQLILAIIKIKNSEILISSIYKPLNRPMLTSNLDLISNSAEWFIAAGDHNVKHSLWHSRAANTAGFILFNDVSTNDY